MAIFITPSEDINELLNLKYALVGDEVEVREIDGTLQLILPSALPTPPPYSCRTRVNTKGVTDFSLAWVYCGLTEFPLIDTSSGTIFDSAWYGNNFSSFPLLDVSNGISFINTWYDLPLTSFPPLDVSKGEEFGGAWSWSRQLTTFPPMSFDSGQYFLQTWANCGVLSSFPAGAFDNCPGTYFLQTWSGCALSQQSVDNILISIDTAGQSDGVLSIDGGTSSTPSATGWVAYDSLVAKGWTVSVNGTHPTTPEVVTDGLVLYLDAGNPLSYLGTGTTWTDLSGYNNNGTLVNGVSYDGGSLVFDGVNDYISITSTSNLQPASLTIFCFIRPQGSFELEDIIMHSGFRFMTRAYKDGGGYGTGWAFWPTPSTGTLYEGPTLSLNTWYCLAVTYTSSELKLYTNAVCNLTGNNPAALSHGVELQICHGLGSFQHFMEGKIPVMMMYNRALTSQEITQNFNAFKDRYGL